MARRIRKIVPVDKQATPDIPATQKAHDIKVDIQQEKLGFEMEFEQLKDRFNELSDRFFTLYQAQADEIAAKQGQNEQLNSLNAELNERLQASHQILGKRESDVVELHARLAKEQEDHQETIKAKASLDSQLTALENDLKQKDDQLGAFNIQIKALQSREQELLQKEEDLQVEANPVIKGLRAQLETKERELSSLQDDRDELAAKNLALMKAIGERVQTAKEIAEENDLLADDLNAVIQENDKLEAKLHKTKHAAEHMIQQLKADTLAAIKDAQAHRVESHTKALKLLSGILANKDAVKENPALCDELREATKAALTNSHQLSLLETYTDQKYQDFINNAFKKIDSVSAANPQRAHTDTVVKCFTHMDKHGKIGEYDCSVILAIKEGSESICGIDTHTLRDALTHEVANSAAADYTALIAEVFDSYGRDVAA
jgi:chromosome segregation ATPase